MSDSLQARPSLPLGMTPLATHATSWTPAATAVTLNARMDARLVPSRASPDGMRLGYAHVVVLDDFFGEAEREALLDLLTAPGWDHSQGPPPSKWERATADGAGLPRTWGLQDAAMAQLAEARHPAMVEMQSRLCRLYPECDIVHMPSGALQQGWQPAAGSAAQPDARRPSAAVQGCSARAAVDGTVDCLECRAAGATADSARPRLPPAVDCQPFVANAPVHGDAFTWHVDADPAALPSSPFTSAFGDYCNGEPGRPLFVSLLLYLDHRWPRDWDAETLFLDGDSDVGLVVRPKRFRAVLMDQDVLHRVSAPSLRAGGNPRYSLVWKLLFLPRQPSQGCCIARPEWGPPTSIGSAARVEATMRSMARKRRAPSG